MGSTGEPDRKRRLSSSVSPAAAPAKRTPCSEDKKLDFAVLKYKNQKLSEQVEADKVEYRALESKFNDLKVKQKAHNDTLVLVNNSWERLVGDLELISGCRSGSANSDSTPKHKNIPRDGASIPMEKDFLSRLVEAGATESSGSGSTCQLENDVRATQSSTVNVLQHIFSSLNDVWHANKEIAFALLATFPENECSRQLRDTSNGLLVELNNVIQAVDELHLKHRQLAGKYQDHRDLDARHKAEQKRLKVELVSTIAELEESNYRLAALKAQRDTTQGTPVLFPTLGNKNADEDKVKDKQKELQDLATTRKELTDVISKRLMEIRRLHEERIEILKKLATFQNILTDFKSISSSKAFQLLSNQLQKSQREMNQYRILLEKLQVDKDKFAWQEREVNVKIDLAEIHRKISLYSEARIAGLEQSLQKLADEKNMLDIKLEEASREPGRRQVISEFKALVSSLPKEMGLMQSEQSKYKDTASELHSLRAGVQSLSRILTRMEKEIEASSRLSALAGSEIRQLQSVAHDLRQTNQELKLFMEMYKRESTDSRDESRDREYKEWANVEILKSSLDEHKLEQRVKAANEAEAMSQQRLATAEAEIAELRQKLETSRRDIDTLSENLKSKHEEGESYLSEIESIGQAYEDIQTQNQQLLQQIIERDDHNTKLFMEGVKAKQAQDALHLEVCTLHRNLHNANSLMELYNQKIVRLEDQLKVWSDQAGRLVEDGWRNSLSLGNSQRKLVEVQGEAQQLRQSVDVTQATIGRSRLEIAELLVELEKERFSKKRIEDDLELMSRKASSLRDKTEGSTILEKLRQEVSEYRGILKCGICHDRQKEVVIAKCYHLFCNQCIQKSLGSRQRRCPSCGLSFGANDVKPIYI